MLKEKAGQYYFVQDKSCAEAILLAANEAYHLGMTEEATKLFAGFRTGMGMGGTCGALSGAIGVLSSKYGTREDLKTICPDFVAAFEQKLALGTTECAPLAAKYKTEGKRCRDAVELTAEALEEFIDKLEHKPVICACSATIPADSLDTIRDSLHMDKPAVLRSDLRRDNLILLKKDVTCNKKTLEERLEFRIKKLCKLIDKYHKDGSVLIFAQTTAYVDALYNILRERYTDEVTRYHSRVKPERHKKELLFNFLHGERKIMISTSAFSMGIDVSDIELVVHFNAPISMTDYIQQIGRAGRDGRKAHCVLFYDQNGDDEAISNSFIKKTKKQSPKAAKTIKSKLNQVHNFIYSDNCMVNDILEYQGQHEVKTCKRCTACAQKRRNSK